MLLTFLRVELETFVQEDLSCQKLLMYVLYKIKQKSHNTTKTVIKYGNEVIILSSSK